MALLDYDTIIYMYTYIYIFTFILRYKSNRTISQKLVCPKLMDFEAVKFWFTDLTVVVPGTLDPVLLAPEEADGPALLRPHLLHKQQRKEISPRRR